MGCWWVSMSGPWVTSVLRLFSDGFAFQRGGKSILACMFPRHHQPLGEGNGGKKQNSKNAEPDEGGPGQRPIELRVGRQNEIAETGDRPDKLTDHSPDYCERYGNLRSREYERQRCRYLNLEEHLSRRRAECMCKIQQSGWRSL